MMSLGLVLVVPVRAKALIDTMVGLRPPPLRLAQSRPTRSLPSTTSCPPTRCRQDRARIQRRGGREKHGVRAVAVANSVSAYQRRNVCSPRNDGETNDRKQSARGGVQ